MTESKSIKPQVDLDSGPLPAVKSFVIWVAVIFAIIAFGKAMMTDTVQTWINGEPFPSLPTGKQVDEAEKMMNDRPAFPPQDPEKK